MSVSVAYLPSTWDACDPCAAHLRDVVSSVPPLTGASNYLPSSKKLRCFCLLAEPPSSHLLATTLPTKSLPVELWSHLDATLALALVGLLSPDLAFIFESIVLDHPSRAARTLWLKLEADDGTRSSYDLWKSVEALTSQP
ncbi:hypothetical protein L202_06904 [Cryptococcus amylolentus CBS 6039]|uniref:Uncharacterized protein n=2 Tax=Cryptococcus amylolentus TaxID=104669 RepID=A0A1E3HGI3_9TREE|nr:hypothetical protein L202_06904 [Cryptococcus amylolentus CBS 6039]ODN74531.1 hypothetical protein L202_06904 [Cryptococcus amylolentus CBS 6039]ODO01508.1 hypothetical protein I350_06328 [Cryptococcus amylolentus CBS 6273]